jgi:hypothetical protein
LERGGAASETAYPGVKFAYPLLSIVLPLLNLLTALVYNENTARIDIGKSLYKLAGNSEFLRFGFDSLQKLYFKEVHVWTTQEFGSNFVEKYYGS